MVLVAKFSVPFGKKTETMFFAIRFTKGSSFHQKGESNDLRKITRLHSVASIKDREESHALVGKLIFSLSPPFLPLVIPVGFFTPGEKPTPSVSSPKVKSLSLTAKGKRRAPSVALKSQFAPSSVVDGSSSKKGKPLSEKNDHE